MSYVIAFDFSVAHLKTLYDDGDNYTRAYLLVEQILNRNGFNKQQGSVYVGGAATTAVDAILGVQEIVNTYPVWFRAPAVKDIRMYRVLDDSDLSRLLP